MKEPYERDEAIAQGGPAAPSGPANIKERIYEKLRMPLWVLDAILILLGLGVVVAVVLGMIRGRVG
ncbi:MAG: hypothetical protein VB099_12215 [Candidatus Limiplasma sp.]|nr:hypothetical protein [Candidatus Limiplasma sp.]